MTARSKRRRRPAWRRCRSLWPLNASATVGCERHRWHRGKHRGGNRLWSKVPPMIPCEWEFPDGSACPSISAPEHRLCVKHLRSLAVAVGSPAAPGPS